MPSTILTPAYAFGATVYTIGSQKILNGEITGINFISPTDGTDVGALSYQVTFNREIPGTVVEVHSGASIYVDHATALTAFGARG